MLSGVQSSFLSTTYMADEADINNSDLYYTELETDLQIDIDQTEQNYPGYDGYRYNIGEISHDPYELMGTSPPPLTHLPSSRCRANWMLCLPSSTP